MSERAESSEIRLDRYIGHCRRADQLSSQKKYICVCDHWKLIVSQSGSIDVHFSSCIMSDIPDVVRARLDEHAALNTLQSPNFNVYDLTAHEPQDSNTHGKWSLDGFEFVFSIVGQVSARQTFLGPYGDMVRFFNDSNRESCSSSLGLS